MSPPEEDIASVAIRRSLRPKLVKNSVSGTISPASSAFGGLLCRRRSERNFSEDVPAQEKLERILVDCAGGVQAAYDNNEVDLTLLDRTIPQSGGIASVGTDLIMLRDSGNLVRGIYRLCPCSNSLHVMKNGVDLDDVANAINWRGTANFGGATALLAIHGNFEFKTYKYGARGIHFVYLEAGCALQNAVLSISDQGMAGYPYGGFNDQALSAILQLAPSAEQALALVIIGMPQAN